MTTQLVGRKPESDRIKLLIDSNEAEFLALYGRRRVGKTLLVRETVKKIECIYFELTGQKNAKLNEQLQNFANAYQNAFYPKLNIVPPISWAQAFQMLADAVRALDAGKKVVLFLDELPWLAGKKSNLLSSLDYVWNTQWVKIPNLKLIVCGSAASWMITHIISDKGGLHNRTTDTLLLKPLTLSETKTFFEAMNVTLSLKQILQIYMITGGIPYYLKAIRKGQSATENIVRLCFEEGALLFSEFDKLFDSLFDQSEIYKEIITIVASKRYGITKADILKSTKLSKSGGRFNQRLRELTEAGFLKKLHQIEYRKQSEYYRIVDEYSFFYLNWILPAKTQLLTNKPNNYWQLQTQTSAWKSWAGYTFETICLNHLNKIIDGLGLSQLVTAAYPWRYLPKNTSESKGTTGAQIDLVLQRNDNSVTLVEIKHTMSELVIDKALRDSLINKVKVYQKQMATDDPIFIAMVSSSGVKENQYSAEILSKVISLEELF